MSIKGVWCVPYKRANGKVRFYYYTSRVGGVRFWESDEKRIGERSLPTEFVQAYNEACSVERGYTTSSFATAVRLYQQKSKSYAGMKAKGQVARTKYLEAWLEMPLKADRPAAAAPLQVFDSRNVIKFITSFRDERWGHSASAADEAIIALSAFLTWCKQDGRLDWNRAQSIPAIYQRPTKNRIWTSDQQARFLESAPWQIAFGFKLAAFTGLRLGDLLQLPLSARTRQHLIIPTSKSRGQNSAIVPIIPPLADLLKALDEKRESFKVMPMTILFNSYGKPWTEDGFSTSFYRHREECGLTKNPPSIHDLRKTAATQMVILQKTYPDLITDAVLVDMFGWTMATLNKMKRIYVNDEAVIAAMTRTERK